MKWKIAAAAAAALLLSGCTAYGVLEPVAGEGQRLVYVQGSPAILSEQTSRVTVALPPDFEEGARIRAWVQAVNGSDGDWMLSPAAVSASDTVTDMPLRVYTYEDLANDEDSLERWHSEPGAVPSDLPASGAAGMPMRAAAAGKDPAAALQTLVLRENTLIPGAQCAGQFEMQAPEAVSDGGLQLEIRAGQETHVFRWRVKEAE